MRIKIAISAAIALSACALAALGANAQNNTNSVTLRANPDPVVYQRAVTLSGQVRGNARAGKKVELQQDVYPYDRFVTVAEATSDSNGTFAFTRRPTANTRYRVQAKTSPQVTSSVVQELVRIRVTISVSDLTPARGQSVRFSGFLLPPHVGRVIWIQRRTANGTFATIARTFALPLDTNRSRYRRFKQIFTTGVYRVRVPGHADHASGFSSLRHIVVH